MKILLAYNSSFWYYPSSKYTRLYSALFTARQKLFLCTCAFESLLQQQQNDTRCILSLLNVVKVKIRENFVKYGKADNSCVKELP